MDDATAERLVAINREFYARFHSAFDETRTRPWPGWNRILSMTRPRRVLDLGCGNGRFARYLAARTPHPIAYEGWDESEALLARARERVGGVDNVRATFRNVDLLAPPWPSASADLVVAFGVMHHIPSQRRRRRVLEEALARASPGGRLVVCFWQFAPDSTPRVAVADWREAHIDPAEVEAGDHLVRWRRGGEGLRYCHHTSVAELDALVRDLPADEEARFSSDGASGDLNLYLVLKAPTA